MGLDAVAGEALVLELLGETRGGSLARLIAIVGNEHALRAVALEGLQVLIAKGPWMP